MALLSHQCGCSFLTSDRSSLEAAAAASSWSSSRAPCSVAAAPRRHDEAPVAHSLSPNSRSVSWKLTAEDDDSPVRPPGEQTAAGSRHAHEYMNQRREEPDVVSIPGRLNWDHSKRRSYIRPKQGEAIGCHCCMLPPDKATANSCLGYLWS